MDSDRERAFFAAPQGLDYMEGWFANPASASAGVDVIVVAVAAFLFILLGDSSVRNLAT